MQHDARIDKRLDAVEESQLFSERLLEQLAEQMKALNSAHDALARRLGALESRLGEVDRRVDVLRAGPAGDATVTEPDPA